MDIDLTVRERNHLSGVANAVRRSPDDLLDIVLGDIVDEVRKSMLLPKSGRPYPPPGFRASAPGQAPAVRPAPFYPTGGELFASISKQKTGTTTGRVYTRIEYARYLEYGTRHMRPRPFMRPAARKVRSTGPARHMAIVIRRAARG